MIQVRHFHADNGQGWRLSMRRTLDTASISPTRSPLLIIPGYGMNSFIFGFHPGGTSMEVALAKRGFEVWSVDLRDQGETLRVGGSRRFTLDDLVLTDIPAAIDLLLSETTTSRQNDRVDIIGCSLGATMMFAYVACVPDDHAGRLVNIGGPVRWVSTHPALRLMSVSPWLIGKVPFTGTRLAAKKVLPAMKRAPWLLSMYLHPEIVDMSQSDQLIQAVEDPNRHVNKQIAKWIKRRDLIIAGLNITKEIPKMTNDLFTILANNDGIVPRNTTLWPHQNIGSANATVLEVGTPDVPMAHADLFISDHAPSFVFEPLATWLQGDSPPVSEHDKNDQRP